MDTIFNGLLNESSRLEANKGLHNSYNVKNKLREEIEHSIVGLRDLQNATKLAHHLATYDNKEAKEMRKEFDKIAVSIEEFVKTFKGLYEEVTAMEVAHELTKEDNKSGITISNGGFINTIDNSKIGSLTIDRNASTFVSTAVSHSHDNSFTFDYPVKITKHQQQEKGWSEKRS